MNNTHISITDTGLDSREIDCNLPEDMPVETKPIKPAMNYAKLAQWNMAQPYHKRVSVSDIEASVKIAAFRGFAMALLATIHGELDGKITARETLLATPAIPSYLIQP